MKVIIGAVLNFMFNEIISHFPCHWIRKLFLRSINKRISKSSTVLMHTKLMNFWDLEIGEHCIINQHVLLDCRRYKVKMADCVDIGPYTRIWTLGHDPDGPNHDLKGADVIIESHVWIASGVTILPGVTLGRGSVIASGAIVTKSTEELSIYGGNPAKFIKKRNNNLDYVPHYSPMLD